jgi:hypothetical protein
MSTGPEHYAQAEWHLARSIDPRKGGADLAAEHLAAAQAHATLALAAATALARCQDMPPADATYWRTVCSHAKPPMSRQTADG